MDINRIKLLVDLTKAKLDILKLMADEYSWQCQIDDLTKKQLLELKDDIDAYLVHLKN